MNPPAAPAPVPFVDLPAINEPFRAELHAVLDRVLESSDFGVGEQVEALEAELAAQAGTLHAVGVGSGTAALHLSLLAAGVGRGDEVILPPNTFFATAEAVIATGAEVVLADIDPATALLDPEAAADAVTTRTAAIAAVDLYGQPVDADRFQALARRHDLLLVEDAAQAIGAAWDGRPAGSLGDAAAFSFYPSKNLGALGQAGAVTTDDSELARRVARLRSHGEERQYVHESVGLNERLDGLQAGFLRVKLRDLPRAQRQRDAAVGIYDELLDDLESVGRLGSRPEARHVHHLLAVYVRDRDEVRAALHREGIGTGVHYPTPVHLQPAISDAGESGAFPRAEWHARHTLSLPLFAGITPEQIERAVRSLARATRGHRPLRALAEAAHEVR